MTKLKAVDRISCGNDRVAIIGYFKPRDDRQKEQRSKNDKIMHDIAVDQEEMQTIDMAANYRHRALEVGSFNLLPSAGCSAYSCR